MNAEDFLKSKGISIISFVQDNRAPRNHYYLIDLLNEFLQAQKRKPPHI